MFTAALAALFFATVPLAARLLYAAKGIDPLSLLSLRFTIGTILLWSFRRRGESLWPIGREWGWLVLAMFGLFATSAGYFLALHTVPAATAVLLVYTYPAFTAIVARLFFREPLGPRRAAALAITFLGSAALVGWSRAGLHAVPLPGLALAAASGLTYAAFGLGSQQLMDVRSVNWVNRWVVTGVAIAFAVGRPPPALLAGGQALLLGGLYLGVVATFLANTLYLASVRLVGATRAGLYSTMEPLFAAMLAWLFLGERLSCGQALGAVMIFLGVFGLEGLR